MMPLSLSPLSPFDAAVRSAERQTDALARTIEILESLPATTLAPGERLFLTRSLATLNRRY